MKRGLRWIPFLSLVVLATAIWSPAQAQVCPTPVLVSTDISDRPQYAEISADQAGINFFWRVGYDTKFFFRRTTDWGVTFTDLPVAVVPDAPYFKECALSSGDRRACPKPDHFAVDGQGNIYVIAYRSGTDPWGLLFTRSVDHGVSFSAPLVLYQDTDADVWEGQMAVDANGVVNIVWTTDNNGIIFQRSINGGVSFEDPITLSTGDDVGGVQLALDGAGNVNVVWTEGPQIVFRRLDNNLGGLTLRPPVFLSAADHESSDPQIAVDVNGYINVVWYERMPVAGSQVSFSRSTDGGFGFSQPLVVTDNSSARTPQLAVGREGVINVAWDQLSDMGRGVYFSRSVDGVAGFSVPVMAMQGAAEYPSVPQFAVDAADNVHLAWSTKYQTKGNWVVLVARIAWDGTSFSEPQQVSATPSDDSKAGYMSFWPDPKMVADQQGRVNVVWHEDYGVYFARFSSGSTPVGDDVTVQPVDPTTGTSPVTVTFSDVTEPGETTVVTSSQGPPPSGAFKLGTPPVYYQIATTATVAFPVTVCINYSGVQFNHEENLKLGHWTGSGWETLEPTSLDTLNNIICGQVMSFSTFALLEPTYAFSGFLPPVRSDGSAVFKSGRTLPLKFQLADADGTIVSDAVASLSLFKISNGVEGSVPVEFDAAGSSNSGTLFRFDAATGQYIYNLNLRGYYGTFLVRATLDDGTVHEVQISVR